MEEATVENKGDDLIDLPPGFRFHPTDEEIITHYLTEKVMNSSFSATAIGDVDLNKCEPWDLPKKAKMGEKEWYFFCQRDRKYPTGMRTNRATEAGYWKATGKDKEIYKGRGCLVGMKKTLVFYKGRAPKGEKTNWVMHEYRLEGKFSYYNLPPKASKDEWVVSRVFHKNTGMKKTPIPGLLRMNSFGDDFFDYSSLPPLMDTPPNYSNNINNNRSSSSFADGDYDFKGINNNHLTNINNNNNFLQPQNTTSNFQTQTSNYHPQIPVQNPHFSGYQTGPNPGYLHQGRTSTDQAFLRALAANNNEPSKWDSQQCKVEQFSSNQSMISRSQDTGLSTDMNTTEISSVVSKQVDNMGGTKSYEDHLEGPSIGSIVDLDSFWGDY
ncbi:hypothetical protein ACOSQ2_014762 [Xanthoceras sorbifolium]